MKIRNIKKLNISHKIFSIKYYGILKNYIILRNGIEYGPYKYNEVNLFLNERKFIHTDLMSYSHAKNWKKIYYFECFDRRSKYNLVYVNKPLTINQKQRVEDNVKRNLKTRALDNDRIKIYWKRSLIAIIPFFLIMILGVLDLRNSLEIKYKIANVSNNIKKQTQVKKNSYLNSKLERKISSIPQRTKSKKIDSSELNNFDEKFQVEDKYYDVYEDYFDDPLLENL